MLALLRHYCVLQYYIAVLYCSTNHLNYQEKDGMVALLTVGCPCKIFVMDKQLFPGHSCEGLCWYHGLIEQEECGLRLSLTEPVNGSFLITAPYEQECIYCLAIWVDNDVNNPPHYII